MSDPFTHTELALLDALQRERSLLRQRELFNRILLHEMSNAVTAVMGGTDLLENGWENPELREFAMTRLRGGASSLRTLLSGVKWMIGAETTAPERKEVELGTFVRGVVRDPALVGEISPEELRVEQRAATTPRAVCPALLRHALGNLVRNARAYGSRGCPVRVLITEAPRTGVCIHVLNQGAKLPIDFAAHAFEPGRKSERGGMGFGLYIVRTCMQRSGGEVVCGSTRRATVFSLVLDGTRLAGKTSSVWPPADHRASA